jgi:TolB-like protein/DNA-binding winged helix-turn-helix (wHTH) protein/Flp pilus assembly protein TadD
MLDSSHNRIRFGPFELDSNSGELYRDGSVVPIAPQPFRLLARLASRPGELVTREELRQIVWGDATFVDFERGLNFCVLQARTALGDDARQPSYIETLPRRGYRFIAAIEQPAATGNRSRSAPRIALSVAVAMLVIVIVAAWQQRARPAPRRMLAVLPFENLSRAEDAAFADGITEELLAHLSRAETSELGLIARPSTQRYRGSGKTAREIGRELHAGHIVTGSIRREGDRVRVTAQLADAGSGAQMWSESFDRRGASALAIQEDIAAKIAGALRLRLTSQSAAALTARSSAAHEAYLRGRQLWHEQSTEAVFASIDKLREAIRLDPGFALPRVALAESMHSLAMRGRIEPAIAAKEIRTQADAALRVAPQFAKSHATRALLAFWYDWQFEEAEESYREAIRLNPNETAALHDHGWLLMARGKLDDGIAEIRRAQELDPVSPRANLHVAWAYIYARRYADAVRESRRALALQPEYHEAYRCLEQAYLLAGDYDSALAARRARDPRAATNMTAKAFFASDRMRASREAEARRPYGSAVQLALAGDKEAAIAWLIRARAHRDLSFPLAGVDPKLVVLHGDRRFVEMVRAIGLEVVN